VGKPQQPELHRSGHTWVDPDHADEVAEEPPPKRQRGNTGRVPPENQPGHHDEEEQDKPSGPPKAKPRGRDESP
jgi:hypothetical protein